MILSQKLALLSYSYVTVQSPSPYSAVGRMIGKATATPRHNHSLFIPFCFLIILRIQDTGAGSYLRTMSTEQRAPSAIWSGIEPKSRFLKNHSSEAPMAIRS